MNFVRFPEYLTFQVKHIVGDLKIGLEAAHRLSLERQWSQEADEPRLMREDVWTPSDGIDVFCASCQSTS